MPWLMWFMGGLLCVLQMIFRNAPSVMTQELSAYYQVSAAQLGVLVSSYYYTYVLLQLPGGIILDQVGTRRMILFIAITSSCAFLVFGLGFNIWLSMLSRLILGLAASCAFIAALKIASQWFHDENFSFMSGLTNIMCTLGGIGAGYPTAYLVATIGWQKASIILSCLGFLLTGFIFLIVKDPPTDRSTVFNVSEFVNAFKHIISDKKLWYIGLVSACLYLPFSAFAELWAIPYLMNTYNISTPEAASVSILLYLGAAFGSFFLAPIQQLWGSYLKIMRLTAVSILFIFMVIHVFSPLPFFMIILLFFLLGMVATGQVLVFSWANEGRSSNQQGMRLGFVNAVTMIAPPFIQPVLGYILDYFSMATSYQPQPFYNSYAYNWAILLFPIFCLIALLVLDRFEKIFSSRSGN